MSETTLQRYIQHLKERGYNDDVIIEEFRKKGYDDAMIRSELAHLHKKKEHERIAQPPPSTEKYIAMIGAACILLFLLWIMSTTQSAPFGVLVGFLPTIAVIVITLTLAEMRIKNHKVYLWLMPILTCALFYIITQSRKDLTDTLEVGNITMLNFGLSMAYVLFVNIVSGIGNHITGITTRKTTRTVHKHIHMAAPESTRKKNIQERIHSLEDKLKALNFTIGRVYRRSNGGTTELRDKIRIPAETYNFFSQITAEHAQQRPEHVMQIMVDLQNKLKLLESTEKDIFGDEAMSIHNLKRHNDGSSRIIDVLSWNDDDPVQNYYLSALQFCKEMIEELEEFKKQKAGPRQI